MRQLPDTLTVTRVNDIVLRRVLGLSALAISITAVSCSVPIATQELGTEPEAALSLSDSSAPGNGEPIKPIVAPEGLSPAAVALGSRLFHEKRLSGDDTVACSTCHSLSLGGTDQRTHSLGIHQTEGGINAPTVLNASGNFVQFWNGRAATLEDQADGPPNNPAEMGSNWDQILGKLGSDPEYVLAFESVYHDRPNRENVLKSIATFERTLVTLDAPFDKFLKGDRSAIDDEQKRGYELFKAYGCASCHQGANVGGNLYQKFGIMGDYFKDRGTPETDADQGRFMVTKRDADHHVFKVPSLRNLAITAPYFHDGSATTVSAAVEIMAKYQLGRPIGPQPLHAICRFLESLKGQVPGDK